MTLTLHLPLELEQRLTQEAKRHGLALDAYTLQLLDKSLPPMERQNKRYFVLAVSGGCSLPRSPAPPLVYPPCQKCARAPAPGAGSAAILSTMVF